MSISIRGNRIRRFLLIGLVLAANMVQGASSQSPLDLRILIDISGDVRQSMPAGQHLDAVAMLLDQLPEGSKAGIWTFGKYTNHLVTYGRVDAQWHALADTSLPSIRSVASWRDISRVVADATFDRARPSNGYRRELLLLSGGGMNISDDPAVNKQAQQKLLAEQAGPLREAGFAVNTIALNGGQGRAFMSALAKETNGLFFAVTRPDLVHTAVARFADSLNPRNSIPFDGREFAIDNTVERFSALLVGASGSLVLESPSGEMIAAGGEIDGVTRQDGAHYVRIDTVAPEMGLWRVQGGTGAGSRIYVESSQFITLAPLKNRYISGENIRVTVGAPNPVEPIIDYQTPVEVMLEAVGFNGAETFIQQLPQDPAMPGRYTMEIPGFVQADNYQLNITVRALDYSRIISHTLQVHELLALDIQTRVEAGDSFYTLTAQARDLELDLAQSRLMVGVTDSANTTSLVTLQAEQGSWRLDVPDDGVSSEYRLDLELAGKTVSGRAVSYKPRPLIVTLPERAATAGPGTQGPEQIGRGLDPAVDGVGQVLDTIERASSAAAGDKKWPSLLMVFAAVCLVIGSGLSLFYLWLRRRQPFQIDLASDAAAYRAAHNISIRRIQEPGRPFQEIRKAATTTGTSQRGEDAELSSPDFAASEQAVLVPDEHGGVPRLDDVVPEDVFPGAMAAGEDLVGEDVLPEDIDSGYQVADEFAPEELVPEDMISRAMELQVAEAEREQLVEPAEGVVAASVSAVEEREPELTEEDTVSEPADAIIEELVAESVDEPVVELVEELVEEPVEDVVEGLVEDTRPDKAVISITRISVEPEPLIEELEPLIDEPEELPDFETVDAALEEEIATDPALAEETELATEWDNVSLLSERTAKVKATGEVAEELAGEDPFADYRAEYEATHGK